MLRSFHFIFFLLLISCSSKSDLSDNEKKSSLKGEYIYRHHDEFRFILSQPEQIAPPLYPWEKEVVSKHSLITKEYFRCHGSILNPPVIIKENGKEVQRYHDCGGAEKHSLPLREGKEFVYPILIDLLNHIQMKTNKKVFITSGHRCPDHNSYVDASQQNQASKHQIAAEVSFYVMGLEQQPEQVVKWIMDYYNTNTKYQGLKEFENFSRYEKGETNVSTLPWMNKEIFIKVFKATEGRNFDNRHPFPYISIQVRYDWDTKEKVIYSWDKAFKNYLRF